MSFVELNTSRHCPQLTVRRKFEQTHEAVTPQPRSTHSPAASHNRLSPLHSTTRDSQPTALIRQDTKPMPSRQMTAGHDDAQSDRGSRLPRLKGLWNFVALKEPSIAALNDYAAHQKKLASTKRSHQPDVIILGVSSQKLPDFVPRVNTKWDGLPESASRNRNHARTNSTKRFSVKVSGASSCAFEKTGAPSSKTSSVVSRPSYASSSLSCGSSSQFSTKTKQTSPPPNSLSCRSPCALGTAASLPIPMTDSLPSLADNQIYSIDPNAAEETPELSNDSELSLLDVSDSFNCDTSSSELDRSTDISLFTSPAESSSWCTSGDDMQTSHTDTTWPFVKTAQSESSWWHPRCSHSNL